MPPLELWAWAFGWTILIESPIVVALTARRIGVGRAVMVALGLQVLTHPALWYLVPRFEPYPLWLVVAELGVTIVEAAALTLALRVLARPAVPWRVAGGLGLITSLVANLTSTLIGFLLV